MRSLNSMEIDFDIHKLVEAERSDFDEPPYMALRRLLNLPNKKKKLPSEPIRTTGRPFLQDGVEVPHGSLARMRYQRGTQVYEGKFLDGMIVVGDKKFPSLSNAADALGIKKDGGHTSLNGWMYWEAKLPGESGWRRLWDMREEVRKRN